MNVTNNQRTPWNSTFIPYKQVSLVRFVMPDQVFLPEGDAKARYQAVHVSIETSWLSERGCMPLHNNNIMIINFITHLLLLLLLLLLLILLLFAYIHIAVVCFVTGWLNLPV